MVTRISIYLPTMDVYGIYIPDRALSNFELMNYAKQLDIPNFRGVFMRDELPKIPRQHECGIVNFNTSSESGTHWVAYYKNGKIEFILIHMVKSFSKK